MPFDTNRCFACQFTASLGTSRSGGRARSYLLSPRTIESLQAYLVQLLRDIVAGRLARRTARRVDLALVMNEATSRLLRNTQVEFFPNVVVSPDELTTMPRQPRLEGTIELLTVRHVIPRKRVELAIAALESPLLENPRLHIVGSWVDRVKDSETAQRVPCFPTRDSSWKTSPS